MKQQNQYSGFVRVRACGLFVENTKLLLVKLTSPITGEEIWIPPGGGVEFKESLKETVKREFKEETNLTVKVGELVFTSEMINGHFHAIEFYYRVSKLEGELLLGKDPEHEGGNQLISDVGFFSKQELQKINVKPDFLKVQFWESKSSINIIDHS